MDKKDAFIKLLYRNNTDIEYFNPKVKCYRFVDNSKMKVLTHSMKYTTVV